MMEAPKTVSPSSIATWKQCPRQWYAKYVERIEDLSGPEAHVGTLAHAVLEDLGRLPPGERTPERARQLAVQRWADRPPPEEDWRARSEHERAVERRAELDAGRVPDPPHGDAMTWVRYLCRCELCVAAWRDMKRAAWGHVVRALEIEDVAWGEVLEVERQLRVDINGVPFNGYLDRLDKHPTSNGVIVLDYKTGGRKPAFLDAKREQLLQYAAVYEYDTGRQVEQVELVWTATGQVDRWALTDQDITRTVKDLVRVWNEMTEALSTGVFDRNPGPLCSWCPVVSDCEPGRDAVVARSKRSGKTIGAHGQRVLDEIADARLTDELERSLAVVRREHLTIVPPCVVDEPVPDPVVRGMGERRVRRVRPIGR